MRKVNPKHLVKAPTPRVRSGKQEEIVEGPHRESLDCLNVNLDDIYSGSMEPVPATFRTGLARWICPLNFGLCISTTVTAFNSVTNKPIWVSIPVVVMGLACLAGLLIQRRRN